jgi:hypothetical protein
MSLPFNRSTDSFSKNRQNLRFAPVISSQKISLFSIACGIFKIPHLTRQAKAAKISVSEFGWLSCSRCGVAQSFSFPDFDATL